MHNLMRPISAGAALAAALLVCLFMVPAPAGATALTAGNTITPANGTGSLFGTFLASNTANFSFGILSGSLTSQVYDMGGGNLQFWYRDTDAAGSTDDISRFTVSGFVPSFGALDVVYRTDLGAGTVPDVSADLTNTGVFGVNFGSSPSTKINPGQSSEWFVVTVHAASFALNTAAEIDGSAGNTTAYGPAAVATVPEPMTSMLIGSGLLGLGAMRWRRREKGGNNN